MLWLWRSLVATAPIGPLAWEPPSVMGVALKRQKKKKKKRKKERKKEKEKAESIPEWTTGLPYGFLLKISQHSPREI